MSNNTKIQHKRSTKIFQGIHKPYKPLPDQLEYGEIAVNYGAGGEGLMIKNSDDKVITFPNKYDIDKLTGKINKARAEASSKYALKISGGYATSDHTHSDYLTESDLTDYAKTADIPTDYLTESDLSDYAKTEDIPDMNSGAYTVPACGYAVVTNPDSTKVRIEFSTPQNAQSLNIQFRSISGEIDINNIKLPDNISQLFNGCRNITKINLSQVANKINVEDASLMFSVCSSLTEIKGIENLDTSECTTMANMFTNCSSLTSLDLSGWDTSKVQNMHQMFLCCTSLIELNVSGWDTSSVTRISMMFSTCPSLETLDVSGWDITGLTDINNIFSSCTSLKYLNLEGWDTCNITGSFGWIWGSCSNLRFIKVGPGFFNTYSTDIYLGGSSTFLGFEDDGTTSNGWLEYIADIAPIITDGHTRTILFTSSIKKAEWAQQYLQILQGKGYTIA